MDSLDTGCRNNLALDSEKNEHECVEDSGETMVKRE